jgi:hypothetical protein
LLFGVVATLAGTSRFSIRLVDLVLCHRGIAAESSQRARRYSRSQAEYAQA